MYEFETSLDMLLLYYAGNGMHKTVFINHLPAEFNTPDLQSKIAILLANGLIEPLRTQFRDKSAPTEFPYIHSVTAKGMMFAQTDSFVLQAKHDKRIKRRFDFEFWKIGFDSIIAILSFLLSVAALIVALSK